MITLPGRKGFTFRIMVLLLTLELFSLGLWGAWSYSETRRALLHSITLRMTEVGTHARFQLAQFYDGIVRRARHSGDMLNMSAASRTKSFPRILLSQMLVDHPEIASVSLVDLKGREIERLSQLYAYGPNEGRDLSADPGVRSALDGKLTIGEVTWTPYAKPQVELAIPMRHRWAKPQFMMLITLNLSALWHKLQQVQLNTTGYVYIVDADRRLLAYPDPSLVFRGVSLAGTPVEKLLLQSQGDGTLHRYRNVQGQDVVGLSVVDPDTGWWVVVEHPVSEALAPLDELIADFLGALLVVLLLTMIAVYYLSSLTLRPLSQLKQAVGRMAAGDRDVEVQVSDITELKALADAFNSMVRKQGRTMEALKQSETRMARFFATATEVAYFHDKGVIIDINPAVTALLGYTPEEVIGRHVGEFVDPQSYQRFQEAVKSGDEEPYEIECICKNGSRATVEVRARNIVQGGCQIRVVTLHDITARKQMEVALQQLYDELEERVIERTSELAEANARLLEMDRLKSMFIASMSHELRTPLNSIIGFTGVILQGMTGEINDKQRDQLGRVYKAGRHLLALINDVIDISKIEAGKIDAYPVTFLLDDLIREATDITQAQLHDRGLELQMTVAEGVELYTDRRRLLQSVLNLLSNAIKFTEAGSVQLRAGEVDGDVEITVSDTGIGIPEDQLKKLFQPFERLDSHLRISVTGTGLGLYLTRKLVVELLGGTVSVRSSPGEGSAFVIRIPKVLNHGKVGPGRIESSLLPDVKH